VAFFFTVAFFVAFFFVAFCVFFGRQEVDAARLGQSAG
jgi:hypothetical protein